MNDMRVNPQGTCTIIVTVTPVCGDNTTQMVNQQLIVDPDINQGDLFEDILLEITPALRDIYVYIANSANGTVSKCTLITSGPTAGLFNSCDNSGASGLNTPLNTRFEAPAGISYANIADYFYGPQLCDVNALGQLSNCIPNNPGPLYASIDIQFNTSDALYAYVSVANDVQPWIYKCGVVSNSGLMENCVAVYEVEQDSFGITFQTFNGVNYAYIANGFTSGGGSVTQCQVLANGDFQSPCTLNDPPTGANSIVFAEVNGQNYAYVTRPQNGVVSKCSVNSTDGTLSACVSTGGSFSYPFGIALYTLGTQLYAYVAALLDDVVFVCPINSLTGDFEPCTNSGFTFSQPYGITF